MKKFTKILAFVLMFALCLSAGISNLLSSSKKTYAYKDSDTTNNVYVNELWDDGIESETYESGVNKENFEILLKYLSGTQGANVSSGLATLFPSTKTAADIRSTTISANKVIGTNGNFAFAQKSAGQGVIVRLGGLDWQVVYITENGGSYYATLYLATTYQEAFVGEASGTNYTFSNGVLTSKWNTYATYGSESNTYPSSMYSTSYIQSILNGTDYATSATSALSSGTQLSVFSSFTSGSMTGILATPAEVGYQAIESAKETFGTDFTSYNFPNDSYSTSMPDTDFYNSNFNYSKNNAKGADWKDCYLWLPSMTETGYTGNNGIWQLNVTERSFNDGTGTVSWLRSGDSFFANND